MFLMFLFFLFCVCLFYSGLFVILLTCLIPKEREKEGVGLEGWRCGKDLGGSEKGETTIRIYCMKKIKYKV